MKYSKPRKKRIKIYKCKYKDCGRTSEACDELIDYICHLEASRKQTYIKNKQGRRLCILLEAICDGNLEKFLY